MRRAQPLPQNHGRVKSVIFGALAGCILGLVFITSAEKIIRAGRLGSNSPPSSITGTVPGLQSSDVEHQGGVSKAARDGSVYQRSIHTMCTSNGSPYLNFQTRIMYGTYQLVQKMPGGENLVAFTRVLHRTKPDILMDEVPTFRAEPLTPSCDTWCEFPVSDRPNAVAQFLRAADSNPDLIQAPWILMLEGDYVWMKPMPAPRADSSDPSWAFPFSYIQPQLSHLEPIMRLMFPPAKGPLSRIPNSGPAPVLMRVQEWQKVVPDWERLTAHIESHGPTKAALGWVREMYAFSIASALQSVELQLKAPPQSPLISQPPHDRSLGNASMFHYTWGIFVNDAAGKRVWAFEKREYIADEFEKQVPLLPMPPLFREGLMLLEYGAYDRQMHNTSVDMLKQMNRAILDLPTL